MQMSVKSVTFLMQRDDYKRKNIPDYMRIYLNLSVFSLEWQHIFVGTYLSSSIDCRRLSKNRLALSVESYQFVHPDESTL